MGIVRVPVSHETCTVLGYKAKSAADPLWAGLDLSRAEPRQSSIMLARDVHLAVPWCHPSDQTGNPEDFDCIYRVRPMAEIGHKWKGRDVEDVAFEKQGCDWLITITTKDLKRIKVAPTPIPSRT